MSVPMHLPPTLRRIEVIVVTTSRGDGSIRSPVRTAQMYYSMDCELLACYDPINGPPDYFHSPLQAPLPPGDQG